VERWYWICRKAGTEFKAGVESDGFQLLLERNVHNELKKRKLPTHILKPLSHKRREKEDRIMKLAPAYSTHSVIWPKKGIKKYSEYDKADYCFIAKLREEFMRHPKGAHDDILDTEAYGEDMLKPLMAGEEPVKEEVKPDPSAYTRATAEPEPSKMGFQRIGFGRQRTNQNYTRRAKNVRQHGMLISKRGA